MNNFLKLEKKLKLNHTDYRRKKALPSSTNMDLTKITMKACGAMVPAYFPATLCSVLQDPTPS